MTKKTKMIIISTAIFHLIVQVLWFFSWDISAFLTSIIASVFVFLPIMLLIIASIVFSIYYHIKGRKLIRGSGYPLIITILSIVLILFFPYKDLYIGIDFPSKRELREEIVRLIYSGELKPENTFGVVILPEKYMRASLNGRVYCNSDLEIDFYLYLGTPDGSVAYRYTQYDMKLSDDDRFIKIKKLDESWYLVITG